MKNFVFSIMNTFIPSPYPVISAITKATLHLTGNVINLWHCSALRLVGCYVESRGASRTRASIYIKH